MQNALNAYRNARVETQKTPTRGDLLALAYTELESSFGQWASYPFGDPDPSRQIVEAKVRLLIVGLIAGIEPQETPLNRNLRGLLRFLLDSITIHDPVRLKSAQAVTAQLREAFVSIREEAAMAERLGSIPSFSEGGNLSVMA